MEFAPLLRRLLAGEHLDQAASAELIGEVMDGALTPVRAGGLLVALAAKGEAVSEVVGAARAMRERSLHVAHGLPMVADIVGTGGDGANTINISTMAALVVAAVGVPVAKHGNRAASSACGSADVLEACGLSLDVSPDVASRMLCGAGFTFMFAPAYHPAMRNVAPVRRELGIRTIFNVLGPLTNPASATHQVVGVARPELLELVGDTLRGLGVRAGAVVHGSGGIDEVSGCGTTQVYSFDEGGTRHWSIDPSAFHLDVPLEAVVGGSIQACKDAFLAILGGEHSGRADVVALNAALALHVCGRASTLDEAFELARATLREGAALRTFAHAVEVAR
ncbi:MAG TPA: anthranilate phosphoribosyltransferase [Verrucomicrobiae bacterium]|jgi:anthranilate phosphoribosyltransferase|nr:anthranilate phosphoribosyltransferase [Verrucomicrobiae bacterium]